MVDFTALQHADLNDAANFAFLVGHRNLADYVHNGLRFQNFDLEFGTFDITSGKAFLLLDEQYAEQGDDEAGEYRSWSMAAVDLDARSGISFDPNSVNHVFLDFQSDTDDSPQIQVTAMDDPDEDWLKIAEIDPSLPPEDRVTRVNEAPDGEYDALSAGTLDVADTIVYPDGTARETAPLTAESVLDNRNDYYDTRANDPQGVVQRASRAGTADSATTAQRATEAANADHADTADTVGDLSQSDIESLVENNTGEWTHLQTLTDSEPDEPLSIDWRGDEVYDRYSVTMYLENQHSGRVRSHVTVNNHTGPNYHITKSLPPYFGKTPAVRTYDNYDQWDIGEALPHAISVEEFIVACPKAVVTPKNHHPTIGVVSQATGAQTSLEIAGHCSRSMPVVSSIQLQTDADATGKITIKGQNLG